MTARARGVAGERARTRGHHEATILSTLVYLAPAVAVVGRKVGQAVAAVLGRWKDGKL